MTVPDDILTTAEVAEMWRVPVTQVQRLAREGRIPSFGVGRYRRYSRRDLDAWRQRQSTGDPLATKRRTRRKSA